MVAVVRESPLVRNTLKKQKLLRAIKTSKTLREAGIKAGYTPNTRGIYTKPMKLYIAKHIHSDPEGIKERFEHLSYLAEHKGDFTNAIRGSEALARVQGMFIDKSEIKSTADVNVNERLTRLTHIINSSNRLSGMIPSMRNPSEITPTAENIHCKPSSDAMVDNRPATHCKPSMPLKVDNNNPHQAMPLDDNNISPKETDSIPSIVSPFPTTRDAVDASTIATGEAKVDATATEGIGGGMEKRKEYHNPPSLTSPVLKVSPFTSEIALGKVISMPSGEALVGLRVAIGSSVINSRGRDLARDKAIVADYINGLKVKELALKYGISTPRVYQLLQRAR